MWVARDKDGALWLFTHKPERSSFSKRFEWELPDDVVSFASRMQLPYTMFPGLKWEDDPLEVVLKQVE